MLVSINREVCTLKDGLWTPQGPESLPLSVSLIIIIIIIIIT